MGLIDDIGRGPVALDSAAFIYFIEEHPRFLPILRPVFEAIDAGRLAAVTSGITLLEVLVVPYRAGNVLLASRYETLLRRSRGLDLVPLDAALLRGAAHLRALHRALRAPDALQIVAALSRRCSVLVTNDRALGPIDGLRVLQLSQY